MMIRQAADNQRKLNGIVDKMQTLSRQILFQTVPGVVRRKRLSKKVLGLIQGPFRTDACMTPLSRALIAPLSGAPPAFDVCLRLPPIR
jgi:hypothetical protein